MLSLTCLFGSAALPAAIPLPFPLRNDASSMPDGGLKIDSVMITII
jgi:hypothetical protein